MNCKRKIIDVHSHVFPEKIATRAVENVGNYYSIEMGENGTVSGLIQSAKDLDASFVISSAALKVENVRHGNDFIFECFSLHPEIIIPFGSIHQDMDIISLTKELMYIKEKGGKGIKLHPDFQHFKIEDPKMFPIYEAVSEVGLPILMHVGDEKTENSTPRGVRLIADKYPELKIIAAHMGGYMAWDYAEEYLIGTNVYMDTSDALLVLSQERVCRMIEKHGCEKILFGSDFPLKGTFDAYKEIDSLPLSEKQKDQIYYTNAKSLFLL